MSRQYTAREIKRVPCARCGQPSTQQWQVCADGNTWRGICTKCDIRLNDLVLRFMQIPGRASKMRAYRAGLTATRAARPRKAGGCA